MPAPRAAVVAAAAPLTVKGSCLEFSRVHISVHCDQLAHAVVTSLIIHAAGVSERNGIGNEMSRSRGWQGSGRRPQARGGSGSVSAEVQLKLCRRIHAPLVVTAAV